MLAMRAGLKTGPSKGTDPPETVSSREAGTARSLPIVEDWRSSSRSRSRVRQHRRRGRLVPRGGADHPTDRLRLCGDARDDPRRDRDWQLLHFSALRRAPGLRALAILEFLIAIAIVLSVAALQLGPILARRAQPVLSRIMPAYLPYLVVHSMLMLFRARC